MAGSADPGAEAATAALLAPHAGSSAQAAVAEAQVWRRTDGHQAARATVTSLYIAACSSR